MVELIMPDDVEGDKRIRTTRKKAMNIARRKAKTHEVVIGTKKAGAKDILRARLSEKIKLIKRQVGG